jgi:lycopene beta-cyclase
MVDLRAYRYQMIRGIDFYRFVRERLSARGDVDFVQDQVTRVEEDEDGARVSAGSHTYRGKWVFDRRFNLRKRTRAPRCPRASLNWACVISNRI